MLRKRPPSPVLFISPPPAPQHQHQHPPALTLIVTPKQSRGRDSRPAEPHPAFFGNSWSWSAKNIPTLCCAKLPCGTATLSGPHHASSDNSIAPLRPSPAAVAGRCDDGKRRCAPTTRTRPLPPLIRSLPANHRRRRRSGWLQLPGVRDDMCIVVHRSSRLSIRNV